MKTLKHEDMSIYSCIRGGKNGSVWGDQIVVRRVREILKRKLGSVFGVMKK